ncbi:hypothetical protein HQ35_05990 [Porphyromonas cangingivalis]|uniref:PKD-like family protein n=1 Tax=Porphyromonas cangingivalis TaxID=36874 RepID=A0A099X046_PORCN|nr:PKD-like family lipoprotein [Porphyromonas cangingivalis]KGL50193.1 hypothetical protein HQ34_00705 [Porphyromonas cangingivalis]KGN80239.1 hypothetical protein HQ35_05990 [Porphyromonas cangingivalis]
MKKIIFSLFAVILGLVSCYDDLGNYEYREINDVVIHMQKRLPVKIPLADSTLVTIPVKYTQVLTKGKENLRYQWYVQKKDPRKWTPCGNDSTVTIAVYPDDPQRFTLRVEVTDTDLDIVSYGEIMIVLQHAFDPCWFVMQEEGNNTVLGAVDGREGIAVVTQNVYRPYGNISGKPKFMAVNVQHSTGDVKDQNAPKVPMLQLFTEKDILVLDGGNLGRRLYTYDRMLLDKKLKGDMNFNPEFAAGERYGECIIDDGVFWFAFDDGCSIYYPVATEDGSAYSASMASLAYYRGVKIVFDDLNKRFLTYHNDNMPLMWNTHKRIAYDQNYVLYNPNHSIANGPKLQKIGESSSADNAFNPNGIGSDKKMIHMGPISDEDQPEILSVARAESKSNTLYLYEISPKAIMGEARRKPYCSGYWEFTPEVSIAGKDIAVATSGAYDRMFFYASGNKIYRVDLNRSQPTEFVIYELPEGKKGEFTNLKFRSERIDVGYATEEMSEDDDLILYRYPTWLGAIVTDQDGNSTLIEVKLNRAGDIATDKETKDKVIYTYPGLKNVKDFVYSFRV